MTLYTVEVTDKKLELLPEDLKKNDIRPSHFYARMWQDGETEGPAYVLTFGQGFQVLRFINEYKDAEITVKYGTQVVYQNS